MNIADICICWMKWEEEEEEEQEEEEEKVERMCYEGYKYTQPIGIVIRIHYFFFGEL